MRLLFWWVRELWIWIVCLSAAIIFYPWWSSAYPYPADWMALGFLAAIGPLTVLAILRNRARAPARPPDERRPSMVMPKFVQRILSARPAQFRRTSLHRSILWRWSVTPRISGKQGRRRGASRKTSGYGGQARRAGSA
jgi:hypothetical protein